MRLKGKMQVLFLVFGVGAAAACGKSDTLSGNSLRLSNQPVEQAPPDALLPLSHGNYWTLGSSESRQVKVSERLDGWFELSGLSALPVVVRAKQDGEIEAMVDGSVSTFVRANAASGGVWESQWQPGACGWVVVTVEKRNASVPTGEGEYRHLVQLSFANLPQPEVRCPKPELRRLWLSAGLGVVGVERLNQAPQFLKNAKTAHVTIPAEEVVGADVLQSPKDYDGKEIQLRGPTSVGDPVCAENLCVAREGCCPPCTAAVRIDGIELGDHLGIRSYCAADACDFPGVCLPFDQPLGQQTTVVGRFELTDGPHLVVHMTK